MQTFIPMAHYRSSLEALDPVRLNKQILECQQILGTILDPSKGYQHHPAVRMWRGHEKALATYGVAACDVRGDYRATWFHDMLVFLGSVKGIRKDSLLIPPWMGDLDVHRSHRSRLMDKDPGFYHWEGTPVNMPYLWPVRTGRGEYDLYLSGADLKRIKVAERELPEWLDVDLKTGLVTTRAAAL